MGRREAKFSIVQSDGAIKDHTLVPFITPDDLMLLAMKAVAAEIKLGIPYASVLSSREITDSLVLSSVTSGAV